MAYRPDASEFDKPLTPDELKERKRRLSMLSPHQQCQMDGDVLPRAALQELVSAWKLLRSWKRRRPPRQD